MFDNIINLLEKSSTATSAELIAALERNKSALAGIEAQVDQLERERQDLLLKSADKEIDALDRNIANLHRQSDRHHAASAKLEPLIEPAIKRERDKEIEDCAKRARVKQADLLRELVELDSLARRLRETLARVDAGRREIEEANKFTADRGRADLKVMPPEFVLATHLRRAGTTLVELPQFDSWKLDGYIPEMLGWRANQDLGKARELIG